MDIIYTQHRFRGFFCKIVCEIKTNCFSRSVKFYYSLLHFKASGATELALRTVLKALEKLDLVKIIFT